MTDPTTPDRTDPAQRADIDPLCSRPGPIREAPAPVAAREPRYEVTAHERGDPTRTVHRWGAWGRAGADGLLAMVRADQRYEDAAIEPSSTPAPTGGVAGVEEEKNRIMRLVYQYAKYGIHEPNSELPIDIRCGLDNLTRLAAPAPAPAEGEGDVEAVERVMTLVLRYGTERFQHGMDNDDGAVSQHGQAVQHAVEALARSGGGGLVVPEDVHQIKINYFHPRFARYQVGVVEPDRTKENYGNGYYGRGETFDEAAGDARAQRDGRPT